MTMKSILLVDDDKLILKYIEIGFNNKFKLLKASNGSEALKILNQPNTNIDLIITDYRMPIINGIELANIIKANNKFNNIPLLLTSAAPEDDSILKQRHLFNKIIGKPFTSEFLFNEVAESLNKQAFQSQSAQRSLCN